MEARGTKLTDLFFWGFFFQKPGEPVYAQVNRDKKRSRQYEGGVGGAEVGGAGPGSAYEDAPSLSRLNMDPHGAGDSWV